MTRQSRRNSPLRHFVPHLLASIKKRLFCTALRPNSIMTVYHLKMEGAVRDAVMCGRVGASAREDATCREVCCGPRNYYHYRMMWNQHSYLPTLSCRSKFCYSSPVLLAFRNGLKRRNYWQIRGYIICNKWINKWNFFHHLCCGRKYTLQQSKGIVNAFARWEADRFKDCFHMPCASNFPDK